MADTLVQRLASFAVATGSRPLPPEVAHRVRRSLLDTIGVALAARREESSRIVLDVMIDAGSADDATVLGSARRLPAASAAMVNGTMAHSLDFDDTHLPSVLHPSASTVPAVLAVAEEESASGAAVLAAIAVGNEITCRLGLAAYDPDLRNSIFFEHGMHATSICGTVGAAAAVSSLHGDGTTTAHGMAIATSMGAGLLEANRTGGSVKRMHCGWAAHAGVSAAKLASGGLTGPPTVLEGRFGFFEAYTGGRFDEEALIGDLGGRWEAARLFTKPYPTNHFTHAGIDAAIALRERGVQPGDVVAIELGVPAPVLRTIAEPPGEKARPESAYHAKFSGPFTVATALVGGSGLGVSAADFTSDKVRDPERLRLAGLVRCFADEEATKTFPNQFPGVLRLRLSDGTELEHRVRYTRGGPENPMSDEEHALKFRLNAEPVLGAARADEVTEMVARIEEIGDVSELMGVLAATPSGAGDS